VAIRFSEVWACIFAEFVQNGFCEQKNVIELAMFQGFAL
jgi:hypothetical protein